MGLTFTGLNEYAGEETLPDNGLGSLAINRPPEAVVTDSEAFIRQAFASDPQLGCELLYRHYFQPLCSHAARFVYSKSIAEDIVSEIFLQFYQKETYKEITTSYRAYLYKSVRHRAYNHVKLEAKRSSELDASFEGFSDAISQQPDSLIQYEELYHNIESAINALPAQRRKVFLMHRFEGKKYAEIAAELQLSPRTVEVQIRKASMFLKDLLSKKWIFLVALLCKSLF